VKVVYIAGKFRGKTAWHVAENVRAAEQVGFHVAAAGAMPVIPHANTAHFDGTLTAEFWLAGTMELLERCDAVIMVPGWLDSIGALAERKRADELGKPVFDAGDYQSLRDWLAAPAIPEEGPTKPTADRGGDPR
jgi:nucleoside 2-deoxyribosyltransferase